MPTNISFAGNDLQTSGIITHDIDHFGGPTKNQKIYPLANANKSAAGKSDYPNKIIIIKGSISAASVTALDALIDTFKGYFIDDEQNLDIDYNGSTRRYIAVCDEPSIQRPRGLTRAEFTVRFTCTQPFGQNTSATSALSETGRTNASYNDNHSFVGNAPYQVPVVTITINSVTGGDGHLQFSNNTTGQGITIIGQTFAASDVVVIDSKQRIVTLNGDEVDYLGAFPEFPAGSQPMHYEDGFSARNFNIDVDYYPLWK